MKRFMIEIMEMRAITMIYLTIISVVLLTCPISISALAVDYRFCIACDNHRANALIVSGAPDFGKEWYRVKTGMLFANSYNSKSCGVTDFSVEQCGSDREERLEYTSVSGDQISALLSGNPVTIGQTFIEVVTGIPAAVYDWVRSWF